MHTTFSRTIVALLLTGSVVVGSTACGSEQEASPAKPSSTASATASATEAAKPSTKDAAAAAGAIEVFFAATIDPKAADNEFAGSLKLVDPQAPVDELAAALTDVATLAVDHPEVAVKIEESKVVIDGDEASVPVSAISITSKGKEVPSSDALSGQINDLVLVDGEWLLAFPTAESTSTK